MGTRSTISGFGYRVQGLVCLATGFSGLEGSVGVGRGFRVWYQVVGDDVGVPGFDLGFTDQGLGFMG